VRHRDVGGSARIRAVIAWLREVFDAREQPWFRAEFVHPREFNAYIDPVLRADETALAALPADGRRQLKRGK